MKLYVLYSTATLTLVGNIALLATLLSMAILVFQHRIQQGNPNIHGLEQIISKVIGEIKNESKETHELLEIGKDIKDTYESDGYLQKPALHVEIDPAFNSSDKIALLMWHKVPGVCYSGSNLTHNNGVITILMGGFYYIYSHIRYKGSGTEELDYGRIVHNVTKKGKDEEHESPTTLMLNLQSTLVIRRNRLTYTTSSLGGTFFLEAGTRVRVYSSVPANIDKSPHGTYFGLFLM